MPNPLRFPIFSVCVLAITGITANAQVPNHTARMRGVPTERPTFEHADVNLAWSEVQTTQRPLLLFVSMNDCKFCDKMEQETFRHPELARSIHKLFVTAKMKKETDPQLVEQLGVRAYPTTLVISPEGALIARLEGFVDPKKFAATIRPALAKHAQSQGRTAARSSAPEQPTPARQ